MAERNSSAPAASSAFAATGIIAGTYLAAGSGIRYPVVQEWFPLAEISITPTTTADFCTVA